MITEGVEHTQVTGSLAAESHLGTGSAWARLHAVSRTKAGVMCWVIPEAHFWGVWPGQRGGHPQVKGSWAPEGMKQASSGARGAKAATVGRGLWLPNLGASPAG